MNRKEFKKLFVEWNDFVSGEEKEVIQEFKVKDALIAGVILAGGFAGIKAVNSFFVSKGEEPPATQQEVSSVAKELKSSQEDGNKLDAGLEGHLRWARENPEKALATLADLEDPASLDGSSVEELEENSEDNPLVDALDGIFRRSQNSNEVSLEDEKGNSRIVDVKALEASEVSGIPLDKENFLDWEDELLDGDDVCLEELADYVLLGGGIDAEDMSGDDLFNAVGEDGKSGGEKAIMRTINLHGSEGVQKVVNALLSAKSQGLFSTKERVDNLDIESLKDLVETAEEAELLASILQKIKDKV